MRLTTEALPRLADVTVENAGRPAEYHDIGDSLTSGSPAHDVADARDWFDLGVMVSVDGRELPFTEVFVALTNAQTLPSTQTPSRHSTARTPPRVPKSSGAQQQHAHAIGVHIQRGEGPRGRRSEPAATARSPTCSRLSPPPSVCSGATARAAYCSASHQRRSRRSLRLLVARAAGGAGDRDGTGDRRAVDAFDLAEPARGKNPTPATAATVATAARRCRAAPGPDRTTARASRARG